MSVQTRFRRLLGSIRTSGFERNMDVLGQDLRFALRNLRKYRETILAPGGSKPAATLVSDFLGRPFDFKAWEHWLNRE